MSAIPDPDDATWLAAARLIPDFVCEAGFSLTERLTTWRRADADGAERASVIGGGSPPRLPQRLPNVIVTADIAGHTLELIAYYRALIAAAAEVGLKDQLLNPFPHFCVKPVIVTDAALADFSWYDTVAEAKMVLRAIATFRRDTAEPLLTRPRPE